MGKSWNTTWQKEMCVENNKLFVVCVFGWVSNRAKREIVSMRKKTINNLTISLALLIQINTNFIRTFSKNGQTIKKKRKTNFKLRITNGFTSVSSGSLFKLASVPIIWFIKITHCEHDPCIILSFML